MATPEEYRSVADDLLVKARALRVDAMDQAPRHRDRLRQRAARLERAARLLLEEVSRDELG